MSESVDDPNLRSVETAFRALTPAMPSLARDRMLYEAGRRSASRRAWPMLTALFAVTTALLGIDSATRPGPSERLVYVPAPVKPALGSVEQTVVAQTRPNPATDSVFSLLLLGAPDYLPAQPARAREIEEFAEGAPPLPAADGPSLRPARDHLGLPPGSLGNPPKRPNDFGPIRRGDV
jgi:hypothetical protein